MLRYTVKPSKKTELRGFPIKDFFVSPDLSFITGTTDYETSIVDGEEVVIRSPYLIGDEVNTINVETVIRQGMVKVKIILPVKTISQVIKFDILSDDESKCYYVENNERKYLMTDEGNCYYHDYELDEDVSVECCSISGSSFFKKTEQKYVEYRGDISYFFNGGETNMSGYLIDHKFYEASYDDNYVEIETYIPIDDGKIVVGNYVYNADFDDLNEKPTLKLNKYDESVLANSLLGICDGEETYKIETDDDLGIIKYAYGVYACPDEDNSVFIKGYEVSKWKKVRKFKIIKHENPRLNPEYIMYGGYKRYVTYEGENYYLRDIYKDDQYLGYGVMIHDVFCQEKLGYTDYEIYEKHKDIEGIGNIVYMPTTDESIDVHNSLVSLTNGGKFMLFVDSSENTDITIGNFIIAESDGPITMVRPVELDEEYGSFITYNGIKYYVQEHLCDNVKISDTNFALTYLDDEKTSAFTIINGEKLYFDISDGKAILSNEVYFKTNDSEENDSIIVEYGINEDGYEIIENSGITINDKKYPLIENTNSYVDNNDNETVITYYTVEINDIVRETFEVTEINGASTYVCYPIVKNTLLDEVEIDKLQREICSNVVENYKSFNFSLRKDTFGINPFTPENGLEESMNCEKPYTMSDAFLLENKIDILRVQNYLSFKFPLSYKTANNIRRDDIIKSSFVDDIKNQSINDIVDMEKDVYYPVYKKYDSMAGKYRYYPIKQLRFNLHFRTRNLNNWKVIEDDREFSNDITPNSIKSNWFITDYKYYNNILGEDGKVKHNSSDLLGFLNFTTSEIKNRAKKLSKSFLRLSFYSTNDPKTQVLLATSTIFFNENMVNKRFYNSQKNSDLTYVDVKRFEESKYSTVEEYIDDMKGKVDNINITSDTISNFTEVMDDHFLNKASRLSSEFVVNDKYLTDTSSEGYYLYMFKEYTKKTHEATVYLKVEFNHAGVGKSIQFSYPREFGNNDELGRPLYLDNPEDVEKLKNGFKMQDIYKQTYIPIKLIYDDNENKYVYYLPTVTDSTYSEVEDLSLRQNIHLGVEDEVMEFNLFETKFANESIVEIQ